MRLRPHCVLISGIVRPTLSDAGGTGVTETAESEAAGQQGPWTVRLGRPGSLPGPPRCGAVTSAKERNSFGRPLGRVNTGPPAAAGWPGWAAEPSLPPGVLPWTCRALACAPGPPRSAEGQRSRHQARVLTAAHVPKCPSLKIHGPSPTKNMAPALRAARTVPSRGACRPLRSPAGGGRAVLPVSPSSSSGPQSWPHGRGTFSKSAVACVLLKLWNQTPPASPTANCPPPHRPQLVD